MSEGVRKCLARQSMHLMEDDRVERYGLTIDRNPEIRRIHPFEFVAGKDQCVPELRRVAGRCPQVEHELSSFQHHAIRLLQRVLKDRARGLVALQHRRAGIEAQQQSLNTLKKGIVEITRNPRSLFESLIQSTTDLRCHLTHFDAKAEPQQSKYRRGAEHLEPHALNERGGNGESDRSF